MEIPASTYLRLAILCLAVGLLLHIISFSSPYWYSDPGIHGGLWLLCVDAVGCDAAPDNLPGVFHFVQAAEAIALIFGLLSVGSVLWLMSSPSTPKLKTCRALSLSAGVIVLCGIITFLVRISDSKDWAAYIELPAGASMVASGVFFALEVRASTGEYQVLS